jgi:streptogramin lyase
VRLYSSPSTRAKDLAILAMRLASDRSEGSSPRSIQAMYLSRQSTPLGAGSTSMTSASLAPYPSRRESTYASFEGSSSMGSAPARFEGAPEGSAWFEGCGSRATDG